MSVFELHCPKATRSPCVLAHAHISLQLVWLQMWFSAISGRFVPNNGLPEANPPWMKGRRPEDQPPENLLTKWRSHAGCGFNLSTTCLL
jgi:hypothetical protein